MGPRRLERPCVAAVSAPSGEGASVRGQGDGGDRAIHGSRAMTPTVRLTVAARPENVGLVRELVAAFAEIVETGRPLDDVRAAVSEAANNVVVHGYGGADGPLEVTVRVLQAALEVSVRDEGAGIVSRESAEVAANELMEQQGPGDGLGIQVMDALADRFELRPREPHGVEAVLRFALSSRGAIDGEEQELRSGVFEPVAADELALAMSPAELGSVVLPRLACAAAARAGFTVDRMSDAQLLADALAAHVVPSLREPVLRSHLRVGRRELAIEVGAFEAGGAQAVIDDSNVGQLGPLLERLASATEVYQTPDGELLELSIRDER
jgi:serine/threonine-protein kinase RsbW